MGSNAATFIWRLLAALPGAFAGTLSVPASGASAPFSGAFSGAFSGVFCSGNFSPSDVFFSGTVVVHLTFLPIPVMMVETSDLISSEQAAALSANPVEMQLLVLLTLLQ